MKYVCGKWKDTDVLNIELSNHIEVSNSDIFPLRAVKDIMNFMLKPNEIYPLVKSLAGNAKRVL